jgi:hypothetical protein
VCIEQKCHSDLCSVFPAICYCLYLFHSLQFLRSRKLDIPKSRWRAWPLMYFTVTGVSINTIRYMLHPTWILNVRKGAHCAIKLYILFKLDIIYILLFASSRIPTSEQHGHALPCNLVLLYLLRTTSTYGNSC